MSGIPGRRNDFDFAAQAAPRIEIQICATFVVWQRSRVFFKRAGQVSTI
jgi:hypothetical protein